MYVGRTTLNSDMWCLCLPNARPSCADTTRNVWAGHSPLAYRSASVPSRIFEFKTVSL